MPGGRAASSRGGWWTTSTPRPPGGEGLLAVPPFARILSRAQGGWRRTVGAAVAAGVPAPALSSTLAHHDALRRDRLPIRLVQGLRDHFGGHGYHRLDSPGVRHHTEWRGDRSERPV